MKVHAVRRSPFSATLACAVMLCLAGPVTAEDLDDDFFGENPPPALLQFASGEPKLQSGAVAWSSYKGSLRVGPCSDNGQFWACRQEINRNWSIGGANENRVLVNNNSVARAERGTTAFDYTELRDLQYSYFADITPATSYARARSDFGSNKAEAAAWNARHWTETRVQSSEVPTQSSIDGFSQSGASASSLYTEVLTPDKDGQIILNFALEQHARTGRPAFAGPASDLLDGDASGRLGVQVFNLDETIVYRWGEGSTQQGFAMVGENGLSRGWEDGPGTSFMSLAFDVVAGGRYSVVSELSVSAWRNASVDFYGTASLASIKVTPGMTLDIGSGTTYNVTAVPEPQTYALLMAGLGVVGWVVRRRQRA